MNGLIIQTLDGKEERLTDYTPPIRKRRVNGDNTLSFTLYKTKQNEHSFVLCEEEATVILLVDGVMIKYKVKEVVEQGGKIKKVDCIHSFLNTMLNTWQYDKLNGSINFVRALNHIFAKVIGWKWVNQASTTSATFENFGDDTSLALQHTALDRYMVEYDIDDTKQQIYFKNKIGIEQDAQFRYGHNIKTYERTRNSRNLSTIIEGFGKDGLHVVYRSPNADVYGELPAKPIRDDRYTKQESLLQACKDTLRDAPDISLKVDIVQLFENGLPIHAYDIGDYIYAILENDAVAKVRILEMQDYPLNKNMSPVIELSNYSSMRGGFSHTLANFAQTQKQVNDILDEEGNLQLQVKKLYRNTNHYSDHTGDWYISPDDPNAYVHTGAGGIDIHKGLMRVEREDGYPIIIGGILNHSFDIQGTSPQFMEALAWIDGPFCVTQYASRSVDCDFFTFDHKSRYIVFSVALRAEEGNTCYLTLEDQAKNVLAMVSTSSPEEFSKELNIDLGVPTGVEKGIYFRLRSANPDLKAYGRVIRAKLTG